MMMFRLGDRGPPSKGRRGHLPRPIRQAKEASYHCGGMIKIWASPALHRNTAKGRKTCVAGARQ
eukprot:3610221-Prorocentrum_lima.AAC.1